MFFLLFLMNYQFDLVLLNKSHFDLTIYCTSKHFYIYGMQQVISPQKIEKEKVSLLYKLTREMLVWFG